jgi:hypothetical protein
MSIPGRILHGPLNVAGSASLIARAQRAIGLDATSICVPSGPYGYQPDYVLGQRDSMRVRRFLFVEALKFDIFHFYFDSSFMGHSLAELGVLKALGKTLYFTFLGCDVRDCETNLRTRALTACSECAPRACSPNSKNLIKAARDLCARAFVTTPDLLEFVPGAEYLPHAVDTAAISPSPRTGDTTAFRVLHAPTDRGIKGTRHVKAAIEALQAEGRAIELVLVEKIPQSELFSVAASCDLVVDQIMAGVYGTFGAEMMAAGLPVIAHMRDDIRAAYGADCPVIDATPATIADVLRRAMDGGLDLPARRQAGRTYADARHSSIALARRLAAVYAETAASSARHARIPDSNDVKA